MVMNPARAKSIDELPHAIQAWENAMRRNTDRTGEKLGPTMMMEVLCGICPADVSKEIVAQQHLFPTFDALKSHLLTIAHNRSKGPAPMLVGAVDQEDACEDNVGDEEHDEG